MTARAVLAGLLLLGAAACKKAPPPQGACPFDLGGTWVNASDERYAYTLVDRGPTLAGEFFLRQPDGSATPRAAGEVPITLSLARGPAEIAGTMRSPAATPSGKPCSFDFEIRFTSCKPDELRVLSEATAPLDESCRRLGHLPDGGPIGRDLAEYTWVKSAPPKR